MAIPIIGEIIDAAKDIVSEVVVDKDKKIEANIKLKELEDRFDARAHEEVLAIQEVNKVEAAHDSIFVAGWRPFAGWIGAVGLATSTVVLPLAHFVSRVAGYEGAFPIINTELLIMVLGGMLGLGGFRTIETVKGVARQTISSPNAAATSTDVEVTQEGDVSIKTNAAPTVAPAPAPKKKKKKFGIF